MNDASVLHSLALLKLPVELGAIVETVKSSYREELAQLKLGNSLS
jgi:hypothetical protein